MMAEIAFKKFSDGKTNDITQNEAERFFRLDDYVTGKARKAKIERFSIMAALDEKLSQAIEALKPFVAEK